MLENLGKTVIVTGSQVKKSKSRLLMDFSLLSDSLLWDTKRWVGQHNWCSDSCRWKYAFLCGKHKTKAQLKMNVYWQEVTKRNLKTKSNQMDEQETTPYPRSVSTLTTSWCGGTGRWRLVRAASTPSTRPTWAPSPTPWSTLTSTSRTSSNLQNSLSSKVICKHQLSTIEQ